MDEFRYLNPFIDASVREDEVWAETDTAILDVEVLNANASDQLLEDVKHVSVAKRTRVRFLVGEPGVGKSHLFSRLRRQLGGPAAFVFAANPPTRSSEFSRWLLERVISGLQRVRYIDGRRRPYSQLQALVYKLLMRYDVALEHSNEEEVHEILSETRSEEIAEHLTNLLNKVAEPRMSEELVRGLLQILQPEQRRLTLRWISGSTNLSADELKSIGQSDFLADNIIGPLFSLLGRLANYASLPIVLVMDQLDLFLELDQINAIQQLLVRLIDDSDNWYVIFGLVPERYRSWHGAFAEATKQKISAPTGGAMPVTEVSLLRDSSTRRALLMQRLEQPALVEARRKTARSESIYPLARAQIDLLSSESGGQTPRTLMANAARLYDEAVLGRRDARRPLVEFLTEKIERHLAADDEPPSDKGTIADRIAELVRIVAIDRGWTCEGPTSGQLEAHGPGGGTHSIFHIAGQRVHFAGHHVNLGAAFPNFARKFGELPNKRLLFRLASASVSGPVSSRLAEHMKQRGEYLSLTRPDLQDLAAIGRILAEFRAGDFAGLSLEPEPSEVSVMRALSELDVLKRSAVVDFLTRRAEDQTERARVVTSRPEPPKISPPVDAAADPSEKQSLLARVRDIMRPLRWLALERLRYILARKHSVTIPLQELRDCVEDTACVGVFELHPRRLPSVGVPQILVYIEDEHAET